MRALRMEMAEKKTLLLAKLSQERALGLTTVQPAVSTPTRSVRTQPSTIQ